MIDLFVEPQLFRLGVAVILSWVLAQGYKIVYESIRSRKLRFDVFLRGGGMPSSHASTVVSFSVSVFFIEGISTTFLLSALMAIIVMRDACGVRHMTDQQSKAMNKLLKTKFPLFTGHTVTQVVVGAIVGLVITCLVFLL